MLGLVPSIHGRKRPQLCPQRLQQAAPWTLGTSPRVTRSPAKSNKTVKVRHTRACAEYPWHGQARTLAYYVYILASQKNGTLYVGITNDLIRRIYEHREGQVEGFTRRHGVKSLVYFETLERAEDAIQREKTLKRWPRDWKVNQIERENPHWQDLFQSLCG